MYLVVPLVYLALYLTLSALSFETPCIAINLGSVYDVAATARFILKVFIYT